MGRRNRLRLEHGLVLAAVFAVLLLISAPAAAAEPPDGRSSLVPVGLLIEGSPQRLSVPALVEAGVSYVPAVEVVNALGGHAEWRPSTGLFRAQAGERYLVFRMESRELLTKEGIFSSSMPPRLINGVAYMAVRDLARAFGRQVGWDGRTRSVVLGKAPGDTLPGSRVAVNDTPFEISIKPVPVGGTLFFPARALLESLGYDVEWQPESGQVWFRRSGTRGAFNANGDTLTINGGEIPLSVSPIIRNGSAYVPLSLLQAAGEDVSWNPAAWAVVARRSSTGPAAFLRNGTGKIEVIRKGSNSREPAEVGIRLNVGDRLLTGSGADAEVELDDGSSLQVGADSDLEVGSLELRADASRKVSFRVVLGRLVARVSNLIQKSSRFEIETPTGIAGVRGTAFAVEVAPSGRSVVAVFSGAVQVSSKPEPGKDVEEEEPVVVLPNQETVVVAKAPPTRPDTIKEIKVDQWLEKAAEKALIEEVKDRLPPGRAESELDLIEDKPGKGQPFEPEEFLKGIRAKLGDFEDVLQKIDRGAKGKVETLEKGSGEQNSKTGKNGKNGKTDNNKNTDIGGQPEEVSDPVEEEPQEETTTTEEVENTGVSSDDHPGSQGCNRPDSPGRGGGLRNKPC